MAIRYKIEIASFHHDGLEKANIKNYASYSRGLSALARLIS